MQGGGNCGNALTGAARLGLSPTIVSKIGGDALGDGIVAEFHRDAVGTDHLLRAPGPSPFTYIIVDREGGCSVVLAWWLHEAEFSTEPWAGLTGGGRLCVC